MRYAIFLVPFFEDTVVFTDFRLIAFCIALFRSVFNGEVYVIDTQTDDFIYAHRKKETFRESGFEPEINPFRQNI